MVLVGRCTCLSACRGLDDWMLAGGGSCNAPAPVLPLVLALEYRYVNMLLRMLTPDNDQGRHTWAYGGRTFTAGFSTTATSTAACQG